MRIERTMMADAADLIERLALPEELRDLCLAQIEALPWDALAEPVAGLRDVRTAERAMDDAAAVLGARIEASRGLCFVPVMAAAMAGTERRMLAAGVDGSVLLETFRCIRRMSGEYHDEFGAWGFDRSFWCWRQCCGVLLRVGTLEYELRTVWDGAAPLLGLAEGDPMLSVHIPSDARLTEEELRRSYAAACAFFRESWRLCHPESERPRTIACSTWLLSPELTPLLDEGSGIRRFASGYQILRQEKERRDFIHWLYQTDAPVERLP